MELKAQHLRIGNYVKYNGMLMSVIGISAPLPRQPEKFNEKWCVDLLTDGILTATIDEIEPVLLTAELIEKFGMINNGMGHELPILGGNELSLNVLSNRAIMSISGPFGMVTPKNIKYLHQLQNVYFSLTDTELELIDGRENTL